MCKMARQHFQFIADTIKELGTTNISAQEEAARLFAARLKRTNSGFNPDRFLTACGVTN